MINRVVVALFVLFPLGLLGLLSLVYAGWSIHAGNFTTAVVVLSFAAGIAIYVCDRAAAFKKAGLNKAA